MSKDLLFQPPRKVTIVEAIVTQIVQQVHDGKLNPGDRLPSERQLITMLGVSRSSVREALQGLTMMGLIESRPGRGSFVSANARARVMPDMESPALTDRLERQMRLQLIEARRTLEGPVARLAAERAKPGDAVRLRQCLEDYRAAPFRRSRGDTAPSPHNAFHLALAEMSGNPFFVPVVETLLRAVPDTLRQHEELSLDAQSLQRIIDDEIAMHEAIASAIEQGDGEGAFTAMVSHLDYERRLVSEILPGETD
jgi:GntR family transcriptional regulator, transcriptional repressor for pyruvate dehydrogenase complex